MMTFPFEVLPLSVGAKAMSRCIGIPLAWFLAMVSIGLLSQDKPAVVAGEQLKTQQGDWVQDLKKDTRLNTAMNIRFPNRAAYTAVFDEIKKATGVPISLAHESEMKGASFGRMTFYKVPAWTVLQQIAATQVRNGRWEKSKDGYALHGEPRPNGLYIDNADAEKARAAEKEETHKQIAARQKAVADFVKMHPLSVDPKLHARLAVVAKNPSLPELFDLLSAATGYQFSVAENLANHEPKLGHFQVKSAMAYSIMGTIAKRDLDDGRWVKTEDGYRLEGTSRLAPPVPPRTFPWLWTLASVGGVLIVAGAIIVYRGRVKKPVAVPSKV